ncbi:MCE family protein [Umezawaea beigongshangensis]|uniref:MCE family protein n=1 Tax=Umezawaea beigongshangensis TaxID=2780383 RepID=UPI0018F16F3A|nr:MCE family protein [Umezawaea beigongshangensis]
MRGVLAPLVKLAVFAVVTVAATAFLAATLAGVDDAGDVVYTARFTDVTALAEGDDVRMSGVRIGRVESLSLVDDEVVDVGFSVEGDRRLAASVTATVKYRNLVGQRYVALEQDAGPVRDALPPGGLVPLERTTPALDLTALFHGFQPLFQALDPDDVNALSLEIVRVLQGEGGTVDSLLAHTASLTSTLASRDEVIGRVVDDLNSVLGVVDSRGDALSELIDALQRLATGFARDRGPVGEAIGGLAALTESTAGLLGDARAPLRDDIASLGVVAANLDSPELESFLRTLPVKLDAIGRTASYGSWLNFYLCSATADVPAAPGGPPAGIPLTEERCRR